MPFERINGINIYYEIHNKGGKRGSVVLLHHGFGCVEMWREIYPRLVEEDFCVVMYDRRGFGRSERRDDFLEFYKSDRYRPESVEELALLMDLLGLDSFHIVGHCEGGVIGVDYAVKYPVQVQTVVASSTQCFSKKSMLEWNKEAFPKPFEDLAPELKEKLIKWHGDYAKPFFTQFREYGGAYGKDFFDLRGVLTSVTCPALVLYPDRSSIFDVEQGVAFYRHLPHGELAVLPYCGHNTYEYRPEEYVGIVLDFIERHDPADGLTSADSDGFNATCIAVRKD